VGKHDWHGFLNCNDVDLLRRFYGWLGRQDGVVEVTVKRRRNTRSLQQLRWYFACICTQLAEYLSEQDYEVTTPEDAHELLKDKFLKRPIPDPRTGEVIGHVEGSTGDLDTAGMADYCERCRAWMLDFFGIVTADPDPAWREKKQVKQRQLTAANAAEREDSYEYRSGISK